MYQILFVDDEPTSLLMTQSLIDWSAFELCIAGTVSNGADALEYVKRNAVHAIVTDLQMPVMDGVTLITRLRESGFSGPILALSNYSDYDLVRGALTAGAFDYLLKINTTREALEAAAGNMLRLLRAQQDEKADMQTSALPGGLDTGELLQGLSYEAQDLSAEILRKKPDYPLIACHILVQSSKDLRQALQSFLATSISGLFEHRHPIDCCYMQNNEFLVLISQAELKSEAIRKKMSALSRQLSSFLSAASCISYAPDLNSPSDIQDFLTVCDHAKTCLFYEIGTRILCTPIGGSLEEFHSRWEQVSSFVLTSLRSKNLPAVTAVMEEFVGFCAQAAILPRRLKNAFVVLFWCCKELSLIQADVADVRAAVMQIEAEATASALVKTAADFFDQHTSFRVDTESGSIHPEIAKALLFIHKYYGDKITLDDVARHIGLNKEYTSRLFLKETGMNLFRYILSVRMNKAVEMMEADENALIKDIALAVGFENQYFFSTKFKEFYGVSPNVYRLHSRQEDTLPNE